MNKIYALLLGSLWMASLLAFGRLANAQSVFSSGFEDATEWNVVATDDTQADFNYDYSLDAIPAAPNGSDTVGLKLQANLVSPSGIEELAVLPANLNPPGDYRVSVDIWGNYGWGLSSPSSRVEFLGMFVGHDGASPGRSGEGFMYTSDGGAARDYRLYRNKTEQFIGSGYYDAAILAGCDPLLVSNNDCRDELGDFWFEQFPGLDSGTALEPDFGQLGNPADFQENGVAGFQWVTMQVDVSRTEQTAQFTMLIHGDPESPNVPAVELPIGTIANTSLTGRPAVVYADLFLGLAENGFSFGVFDNFVVEAGDFNNDGLYDCDDVDALVVEIVNETNATAFELTGDSVVDVEDLDLWLALAGDANLPSGNSYLYGDADLDGVVDVRDFNIWNQNKLQEVQGWCFADFNADGVADTSDFNLWNGNKFSDANVIAVPEPNALTSCFYLYAVWALFQRRQRGY